MSELIMTIKIVQINMGGSAAGMEELRNFIDNQK